MTTSNNEAGEAGPTGAGANSASSNAGEGAIRGRRPITTREHVAREALQLFDRRGFEETTVDDIAEAVGIGRRTFFRYYESKRDVVWGEFDAELVRLRGELMGAPPDEPMMTVLCRAVKATNRFGARELGELRIRMTLIGTVPALVAHSAVRYSEWCNVVAEFAGTRMDAPSDALGPQSLARASLGVAMAAFSCWARGGTEDLVDELDQAFRLLATGFADVEVRS